MRTPSQLPPTVQTTQGVSKQRRPHPTSSFPFSSLFFLVGPWQKWYISVNAFPNPAVPLGGGRRGVIPMLTSFKHRGTNSSCSLLEHRGSWNSGSLGIISPDTSTQVYLLSLILAVTELTTCYWFTSRERISNQSLGSSRDYLIQFPNPESLGESKPLDGYQIH